ncbi:MAG: hypothetical protein AB8D78_13545 [Akkermansiaceae bacterium]
MKFIFPILAILVSLGAVYFTLTESEKFENIQGERLEAISTNKTVTRTADALDVKNTELQENLDTAKNNLELAIQNNNALESTGNALKNEVQKLAGQLAAQEEEIGKLNEAIKNIEQGFAGMGDVTIDNLPDKVAEINENLKTKRAEAERLQEEIEGATARLATKREEVQRLVQRKTARNKRISLNSMEARITAVNQDWGFVVIGAGSNSNFTPQTSLLVKRDGRLIGSVSPSAIEPTQTIADIDLESLVPGVRLQPGDRVILAKPASN